MGKDDDLVGALAVIAGIGAGIWLLGKALSPSTKKSIIIDIGIAIS